MQVEPSSAGCTWNASSTAAYTAATASWTETTLAEHETAWPGGEDLLIGGRPAYYSPVMLLDELLIEMDDGVLYLMITGFEGDVQAALSELGELAVERSASLPPPPEPAPVAQSDPILEELFPTSVAGKDVTVLALPEATIYVYRAGETIWYIDAEEPALTEILAALP